MIVIICTLIKLVRKNLKRLDLGRRKTESLLLIDLLIRKLKET